MTPAALQTDSDARFDAIFLPDERLPGGTQRPAASRYTRAVITACVLHIAAIGWACFQADRQDTANPSEAPIAGLVFAQSAPVAEAEPAAAPSASEATASAPTAIDPIVAAPAEPFTETIATAEPPAETETVQPPQAAPDPIAEIAQAEPMPTPEPTPDGLLEPAPSMAPSMATETANIPLPPLPVQVPPPARVIHAARQAVTSRLSATSGSQPIAAPQGNPTADAQATASQRDDTATARAIAEAMASFEARIRGAVQAAVHFPHAAQMMGLTGRAQVFLEYRAGLVGNLSLARSAGTPLFDDAALDAVRSANYPKPPPELGERLLRLLVWVEFRHQG